MPETTPSSAEIEAATHTPVTLPSVPDPLDEAAVAAAVEDAFSAIAAAADLDALKAARLAHTGEKSPLALANRAIGSLPKESKAAAGKTYQFWDGGCWKMLRRLQRVAKRLLNLI